MRVYSGISVVNLAVRDIKPAVRFYESLGFRRSLGASEALNALFELNNIVLSLRQPGASDVIASTQRRARRGASLSQYHTSPAAVSGALAAAAKAGAAILRDVRRLPGGGVEGAFSDPDGHIWELVYDPRHPVAVDGTLSLPQ